MRLSICIPTYNREKFLVDNVLEIIRQVKNKYENDIEILISDNASTDNTGLKIKEITENNKSIQIKYECNSTNLGPDVNYYKAMKMAEGKYSWLLGSDDIITEEAIDSLFEILILNDDVDVILFNRINCDSKMNILPKEMQKTFLRENIESTKFDFSGLYIENYYYSLCNSLGGLLSYISSVVFKTEIVNINTVDKDFIGTAYMYLQFLFKRLSMEKGVLLYIKEKYVYNRVGYQGFGAGANRFILDCKAYILVYEKIINNKHLRKNFLGVLKHEHDIKSMLFYLCKVSKKKWANEIKPLLFQIGWSENEIVLVEKFGNFPNFYQSRFKQIIKNVIKFNLSELKAIFE